MQMSEPDDNKGSTNKMQISEPVDKDGIPIKPITETRTPYEKLRDAYNKAYKETNSHFKSCLALFDRLIWHIKKFGPPYFRKYVRRIKRFFWKR